MANHFDMRKMVLVIKSELKSGQIREDSDHENEKLPYARRHEIYHLFQSDGGVRDVPDAIIDERTKITLQDAKDREYIRIQGSLDSIVRKGKRFETLLTPTGFALEVARENLVIITIYMAIISTVSLVINIFC